MRKGRGAVGGVFGQGAALAALLLLGAGCSGTSSVRQPLPVYQGTASWYGQDFHGRPTSSGQRYDMYGLTAASRDIPLGSRVRVTRLDNGRAAVVTVNDRGPFVEGRIVDLSYGTARRLGMVDEGLAEVRLEILSLPPGAPIPPAVPSPAVPSPAAAAEGSPGAGDQERRWISLGTFTLEKNAVWFSRQVAGTLPRVKVTPEGGEAAPRYRVVVGPVAPGREEEETLRRVRELGLKGTALTGDSR
jgi:rare lipoprotein A